MCKYEMHISYLYLKRYMRYITYIICIYMYNTYACFFVQWYYWYFLFVCWYKFQWNVGPKFPIFSKLCIAATYLILSCNKVFFRKISNMILLYLLYELKKNMFEILSTTVYRNFICKFYTLTILPFMQFWTFIFINIYSFV